MNNAGSHRGVFALALLLTMAGGVAGYLLGRRGAETPRVEEPGRRVLRVRRLAPPPIKKSRPSGPPRVELKQPNHKSRDPSEWQGMLVDVATRAVCRESQYCGMALACIDGLCSPCEADSQCDSNESCVLDHCVRKGFVGCRTRRDCPSSHLCVLTGYSSDARGNSEMRSLCIGEAGATPVEALRPGGLEKVDRGTAHPEAVTVDDLLDSLRRRRDQQGAADTR